MELIRFPSELYEELVTKHASYKNIERTVVGIQLRQYLI
jgi:hypothetical protein